MVRDKSAVGALMRLCGLSEAHARELVNNSMSDSESDADSTRSA